MTFQWIGLAAAWLASGYRLWVSFRQPATLWRTSFTIGIVCAAIGVTLQSFTPQVDAVTAPSVGSLLNHLVIIVGLGSVQVYVATLRRDTPPPGMLRRVVVVAAVAETVTVVSWTLAAPLHSGEAEQLAVYATDVWVLIYFLTFWALIAVTMVEVARFCLLEQRGAAPQDRARVVSLSLIGLGALGGVLCAARATTSWWSVWPRVSARGSAWCSWMDRLTGVRRWTAQNGSLSLIACSGCSGSTTPLMLTA